MDRKLAELKDTVRELLQNLSKRIDDLAGVCDDTGDIDAERLVNLFEDLHSLAEGINILKNYYSSIDMTEFREKIDMMEMAMEEQDMILLSDIMKYELRDLLGFWEKCLAS